MSEKILYIVFECVVVVFEAMIVSQYLKTFFSPSKSLRILFLGYSAYAAISMAIAVFLPKLPLLTAFTVLGIFLLTLLLYEGNLLTKIFVTILFIAIVVGTEFLGLALFRITDHVYEYGLDRILYVVTTKLLQVLIVKMVGLAIKKDAQSLVFRVKQMLPLFICQVFFIILAFMVAFDHNVVLYNTEPLKLITMLGILYVNFIIFWYFENIKATAEYKRQKVAAEIQLTEQIKYYYLLEERQKETDAHWHDIQKHVNAMEEMLAGGHREAAETHLTELKQRIDSAPAVVRTPHPIINAVLTNGLRRAEKIGVAVKLDVRMTEKVRISSIDLCVLIGNAFDNGINACELLPEHVIRSIEIKIYQKEESLLLEFRNSFDPQVKKQAGVRSHGLGLKNIEKVIERNKGFYKIEHNTDIFCISMVLP